MTPVSDGDLLRDLAEANLTLPGETESGSTFSRNHSANCGTTTNPPGLVGSSTTGVAPLVVPFQK
jgi:hypothetical protein